VRQCHAIGNVVCLVGRNQNVWDDPVALGRSDDRVAAGCQDRSSAVAFILAEYLTLAWNIAGIAAHRRP
jgi:hypothetical protein